MNTTTKLISLHCAIIPDYDRIRTLLPSLVDFHDDDYTDQALIIRECARTYCADHNFRNIDLTELSKAIEAVMEMG